jgi:hypothetical protein
MIKTLFRFVLLLSITALFSSCIFLIPFTYKVNLDQQSPADQNVIVTFKNDSRNGHFRIKEWNGKNIEEAVYKNRLTKDNDKFKLTVPAGDNGFMFNINYTFSNQYSSTTHKFENIELRYSLEPGKKYEIRGRARTLALGFKGIEFYVELFDTTKRSTLLKSWMIGKT